MEQIEFANPKLQRFLLAARPRSLEDLLLGIVLETLAWAIFVIGLLISLWIIALTPMIIFGVILFILFLPFGGWVRRLSKARRIDPRSKLMKDGRDPVLYLRSFDADSTEFRGSIGKKAVEGIVRYIASGHSVALGMRDSLTTSEELIATVLADVGHVITVGIPGEKVSPIGATRVYFQGKDWQANVEYLISISRLVILQADISEGLEWEIAAVKRLLDPSKLLLSFLSWDEFDEDTRENLYELFKPKAELILGLTPPDKIGKAMFICFEADWAPKPLEVNQWKRTLYLKIHFGRGIFNLFKRDLSAATIRETVRDALKQRGMKLKARGSLVRALINLFIALYMTLGFFLIIWKRDEDAILNIALALFGVFVFLFIRKRAAERPPSLLNR